jgi:hypothetical protein
MTTDELTLPVDIPWRRLCVSDDMIDENICDEKHPYRWRSSVAVFGYEPPREQQPFDDMTVSYLKVVCTITGLQAGSEVRRNLGWNPNPALFLWDPNVRQVWIDKLTKYYGCYGAILEVSIEPKGNVPKASYPYFVDFEPKRRETYEIVTQTGEILSRSLNEIHVGKSSMTTSGTTVLDTDKKVDWSALGTMAGAGAGTAAGGPAGAFIGGAAGGIVGGFLGGGGGDKSTTDLTQSQKTDVKTADRSQERRELYSHTTQLTQMYHEFTGYHLGTNRAMFFMLPRPHIVETERTFVQGPRILEGIQEVFLVVMRPRDVEDYCVSAYLETAHIDFDENVYPKTEKRHRFEVLPEKQLIVDKKEFYQAYDINYHYKGYSVPFFVDAGWEIDFGRDGGYTKPLLTLKPSTVIAKGSTHHGDSIDRSGPHVILQSVPGELAPRIFVTGKIGAGEVKDVYQSLDNEDILSDKVFPRSKLVRSVTTAHLTVDTLFYLRRAGVEAVNIPKNLFLTGRGVCCCLGKDIVAENHPELMGTSVVSEMTLQNSAPIAIKRDTGMEISDANRLHAEIRQMILRSVNDPDRYPRGAVGFTESQFLGRHFADLIDQPGHADNTSVRDIAGLKPEILEKIMPIMPKLRRAGLLRMSLQEMKDRFDLADEEAIHLRRSSMWLKQEAPNPKERWDPPGRHVEHRVPDLTGLSLDEARLALMETGLSAGSIAYLDNEQPTGTVLNQHPEAGESVHGGQEIDLVIATGLTVRIPDIIDKPLTEALRMLQEAGLQSEPVLEFTTREKRPSHIILDVTPRPRTYVTPNAKILLKVANTKS